ncbi:FAD-binding oxidoreductase [Novosphingobium sp. LASN5T]|uniref:FAD-binding oxidoreductase n=1 Tax=Novosphingobium sp. LASN5T TaxID=2491021 RepID=UPI000F5F5ADD|nr:FAD-binding oxidoreductase [Novosphingobium sp. LASN5T]RQW35583.1 FAD-binding oxidoreductase [Novosphingobium sp. LASN5T]
MKRPLHQITTHRTLWSRIGYRVLIALTVMLTSPSVVAQTADEHASHHPGGGGAAPAMPAAASGTDMPATQPMGGSGTDPMAAMMKQMMSPSAGSAGPGGMGGTAAPSGCCGPMGAKPFYPSLMQWPALTDEARRAVRAEALKRLGSGTNALAAEQSRLHHALASNDFATAGASIKGAREGLAQAESGVSALKGLEEGKAPREIALTWFKNQNGIGGAEKMATDSGLSWWHIIGMVLLAAALLTALLLRQARLRRIASLVERLMPGSPSAQTSIGALAAPTAMAQPAVLAGVPQVSAATNAPPPVRRPWKGVLRIKAIFDETPNVKSFRLMEPDGGSIPFTFLPGQYATITSEIDGQKVRRSYTISSSPTQRDYIELTIKREQYGLESRHLHDHADTGDLLEISAPAGRFFFTGKEADGIVLIAGGVGITPMMSVLRSLTDRSYEHDIFLLYGVNTPEDLIFRDECDHLARRHPKLHVAYAVAKAEGTDWQGHVGYITADFIAASVPDISKRRVHLCGPPPMMAAVKEALAQLKVPSDQVKTEEFAPPKGGPVLETEPTEPAVTPAFTADQAVPIPSAHATITFSKSGKAGPLAPDQSVLEAAEAIGVAIDYDCRAGTCGRCKVPLRQGQATMEVEDALAADEKAAGIILACQAKSTGDLVVEA